MVLTPRATARSDWRELFKGIYLKRTVMIWGLWVCAYMINNGLVTWLPTLDRVANHLLHAPASHEREVGSDPARRQPRRRLDDDRVSLHDAKDGDHADQRLTRVTAQAPVHLRIARERPVPLGVRAAVQRERPIGVDEPGGNELAPDGLGHRHDERRGAAIEPAIGGVRPHRQRDVARPHEGPRTGDQPIGDRGEPVLLAAVHVNDVGALQ